MGRPRIKRGITQWIHVDQGAVQESNVNRYGVLLRQGMPRIKVLPFYPSGIPQGTGDVPNAIAATAFVSAYLRLLGTIPLLYLYLNVELRVYQF
ncbi:hypothetical protein [Rosenbergiella nectarea]|uniref:hypothetical protein n=1 Tax=Rosenbergiella nectarea TaxID=988801 RepID=UPI001BD91978|nr:hypothetical protein [Rosenbergiella nectarea]MBT0729649.1 hypothetical protein [Rosenbergiella nectarea subsp. apis]